MASFQFLVTSSIQSQTEGREGLGMRLYTLHLVMALKKLISPSFPSPCPAFASDTKNLGTRFGFSHQKLTLVKSFRREQSSDRELQKGTIK